MIVDRMENGASYPLGAAWEEALRFLDGLGPETPEGEYPLRGEKMFARVMTYDTRGPGAAVLEAHRKYVDIQAVLSGREAVEWFPLSGLEIKVPYDPAKDVAFFSCEDPGLARIELSPGVFMVFFPQDAHMPALTIGHDAQTVKKVVIKVAVDLLERDPINQH